MDKWIKSRNKEIISIIIPTFNRSKFLASCLKNIYNSNFNKERLEIIIIDDGSNLEQAKLNETLANYYSAKYIYLKENSGTVSIPRNIGISHASGATIAPTDDDCLPTKNKFNILYNLLWESENAVLAFGERAEYEASVDGDFVNDSFKISSTKNYSTILKKEVGLDNGQFIYKTSIYSNIKPSFAINACDWELYKQIADYGDFKYTDEIACQYLWHNTNISKVPKFKRTDPQNVILKYLPYFNKNEYTDACFSQFNS